MCCRKGTVGVVLGVASKQREKYENYSKNEFYKFNKNDDKNKKREGFLRPDTEHAYLESVNTDVELVSSHFLKSIYLYEQRV